MMSARISLFPKRNRLSFSHQHPFLSQELHSFRALIFLSYLFRTACHKGDTSLPAPGIFYHARHFCSIITYPPVNFN